MAKARLTDEEIDSIVALLANWSGKLGWEQLVGRVSAVLGRTFSRQGLDKHFVISSAFQKAKERLKAKSITKPKPNDAGLAPELVMALRRIEVLQSEIAVLKSERDNLREKFATWLYNIRTRGISEQYLNQPLPRVDRGPSEKK